MGETIDNMLTTYKRTANGSKAIGERRVLLNGILIRDQQIWFFHVSLMVYSHLFFVVIRNKHAGLRNERKDKITGGIAYLG